MAVKKKAKKKTVKSKEEKPKVEDPKAEDPTDPTPTEEELKNEETPSELKRSFGDWGNLKNKQSQAVGASIKHGLKLETSVTEKDFDRMIEAYLNANTGK